MNETDRIKTCPQCGAKFTCSTTNCWCSDLPPIMPMEAEAGCYCPQCLRAIIDKKITEGRKEIKER